MHSRFLRVARRLLVVCLSATPALAVITCKLVQQIPVQNYTPRKNGSIPPSLLLMPQLTEIEVFSNGDYVSTVRVGPSGSKQDPFAIEQNGRPYTDDIIANPDGIYDAGDTAAILNSICPNGVGPAGDLRGASPKTSSGAFITPAYGQAAGPFAYGDFNGDGILDTATASPGAISVALYGQAGTVVTSNRFPIAAPYAGRIVVGDFNGDGILDLAVTILTNSPPGMVAILLGKGDGTFASATYLPGGPGPLSIVAADFNGDGKLDLAISNQGPPTGSVTIFLGKGDGTFAAPVSYSTGQILISIVATDLNGDGKLDLAVLDSNPGSGDVLWVLFGKGDGTFQPAIGGNPSGTMLGALGYTDLNRDGKQDVLIADSQGSAISVLLGKGDGTFQPPTEYVSAAQPPSVGIMPLGDGNTALFTGDAISGDLMLTFAGSDGTVNSPQILTVGLLPAAIGAADLNKDGKPDIVVTDGHGNALYVLLNSGGGAFANPVSYAVGAAPGATAIADVNGDGKLDLVVADANGVEVLPGNGDGTFRALQTSAVAGANGSSPIGLAVGDFNGDGKPDAAVTVNSGQVSVLLGQGNGTFAAGASLPLPSGSVPAAILTGDVDGDGKLDLVVAYSAQDQFAVGATVAIFLGKGDGTFQAPAVISLPGSVESLSMSDVNKDGRPDLIAGVFGANGTQVAVLLGKGGGAFQAPSFLSTETAAASITITDLDGDGKLDVVLGDCCGLTEATYLLGNGGGTFQPEVPIPTGPDPRFIVAADLNGDGKPDLAIAGDSNHHGTLTLFQNAFGTQATANPANVSSSANPTAAAIAPGSLASAYGTDLATGIPGSTGSALPTSFGGTSISIVDSHGTSTAAPLLYVSSAQVNFLMPASVATGAGQVTVTSGDGTKSTANVQIATVAPGVFSLNGTGLAAAVVQRYSADGTVTNEPVYTVNSSGAVVAKPIDMGSSTDQVYLLLYGTGFQAAGSSGVTVSVGGIGVQVAYAGPSTFPGEDQLNAILPQSLAGKGNVTLQLTAVGVAANIVNLTFQ